MKIYAVSRGHPERMHTFVWMDQCGYEYDIVVDDRAAAKRVANVCNAKAIHVTKKQGVLAARAYISKKLVKRGEWYVGIDDNIRVLHQVHPRWYNVEHIAVQHATRQRYRCVANHELHTFLDELRTECERVGTVYGGFASQENPFFRLGKWGYYRFVKTKLFVMKNNADIVWGGSDYAHDSFMSAYVVAKYGRVVVNSFVHPAYKMYEVGGLGKREERTDLEPALDEICRAFPGLVQIGRGANTALRFVRHSDASVEKWRRENGWL